MSNSNIYKNNYTPFDVDINNYDYWDFHLTKPIINYKGNPLDCLSSEIDASKECVRKNNKILTSKVEWEGAINNKIKLENIGMTGIDNGMFLFNKKIDTVEEEEFNNLFYNSTYEPLTKKLTLKQVDSDNKDIIYPPCVIDEDSIKFNGSFYQGIFCTDECDYKLLPIDFNEGAMFEFIIKTNKPSKVKNKFKCPKTLNDINPKAKGIFFYIGTRAENKWARYYNNNIDLEPILTKDGKDVTKYNVQYIESDNKHLMFDRTESGLTADKWEDGTIVQYEINKREYDENPFILFNKTDDGYTTETIDKYKPKSKSNYFEDGIVEDNYYNTLSKGNYNILADLYNNALAFQIKDDNSIGYKYLVKDCENNNKYKIEEEYSKKHIIKYDEWVTISIRIKPLDSNKMKLLFYINGKLVLVSHSLPMINLRKLNDEYSKQEGVPFNISLGGGTQGLCDVIYPDYKEKYNFNSILASNFGGSFIGNIKRFRTFACDKHYEDINYLI